VRTNLSATAFELWCSYRCPDDFDAFAVEHGVEVAGELAVAVADEEPKCGWPALEGPRELARLLDDPRAARLRGAAGEMDAATLELNEEEQYSRFRPSNEKQGPVAR
jgi:hypothetical protein